KSRERGKGKPSPDDGKCLRAHGEIRGEPGLARAMVFRILAGRPGCKSSKVLSGHRRGEAKPGGSLRGPTPPQRGLKGRKRGQSPPPPFSGEGALCFGPHRNRFGRALGSRFPPSKSPGSFGGEFGGEKRNFQASGTALRQTKPLGRGLGEAESGPRDPSRLERPSGTFLHPPGEGKFIPRSGSHGGGRGRLLPGLGGGAQGLRRGLPGTGLSKPGRARLPEGRIRVKPGALGEGPRDLRVFRIPLRPGLEPAPVGLGPGLGRPLSKGKGIFGPSGPSGGKIPGLFEEKRRGGGPDRAHQKGKPP